MAGRMGKPHWHRRIYVQYTCQAQLPAALNGRKVLAQCGDRHVSPCTEGQTVHSGGPGEEDDSLRELQEAVSNLKEQCASVRPL